jgi:hypothetical protein
VTVTVEVPDGHKFCPCCGGVFPKETGFHVITKRGVRKLESRCKECKRQAWHKSNQKARGTTGERTPANNKPHELMSLDEIAEAIVEACWGGPQTVYRAAGMIRWRPQGGHPPKGGELIGVFNIGADYRDLRGSLEA